MMNTQPMTQYEREKALFKYSLALESGNLDALSQVLQLAETDPQLEEMILEISEAYQAEIDAMERTKAENLVRQLLREHLSSSIPVEEEEPPPITVADVAARIQADHSQRATARRNTLSLAKQLQTNPTPLPPKLGLPDVMQLLYQLGVAANNQFVKLFRETAIMLSMGRQQGLMAATRRQKKKTPSDRPEETQ